RRPLSSRPRLGDGGWRDFGGRLTELAEHLLRRGIRLVYHHHVGTVVESEAEIDRLMAETGDSVGLLLDTGHLAFAGADPAALARRSRHRIEHVHCKDVRSDILASVRDVDESFIDDVLDGVVTLRVEGCFDIDGV